MIRGGGIGNAVCGEADTADGRTAAANARSATYSPVDGSLVSYTVTATNTSDTTKKTSLELDPGETEFEIKLIEGTYTLSVEGFLTEGESRKKILRGTYRNAATNSTVTIDKEHPNPQVGKIYVNPFFDEGGTGTVSLKMNLSGCKIKSVKAVWKKQGADGTEKTATFDKSGSVLTEIFFGGLQSESEEYAFAFSESESTADIPSGIYEVTFSFYSDATQQDEVHKLFSCTHSLNVYQNLTAGWWKSSTAGATYISDGKFTLTQEIINGYIRHKFYVDQSKKATSLNEGTWYAPFDSVKTAVEKIRIINDGEPFTVILLSDDTDESTASYTSGNKAYIDIAPNTSLPLAVTILGKDGDDNDTLRTINAALTADRTGSVMYIGENAAVTLKNIHITGGYSSYNTGSGIINKGTLSMEDCTVSGCIATHCGGGGIGNFGTLTMNTCTVSDCTAELSGGAIFNNGTLTVNDCTISSCEADWGGGGISNGKTGTLTVIGGSISLCKGESSSGGGGIYNQGTLTVTGCTISGNESYNGAGIRSDVSDASVTVSITDCEITCRTTSKGGGISNSGPLTVTGCTIICDGTSGTSGLGIYNEGGTADIPVTVTDCTISGRKRASYGGGIYNTGTLIVTGGTISSCEATKGGGIWNGGTLTVSGTSISSCKATGSGNYGGGGIFSGGGETAAVLTVEGSTKISGCTAAKIGGGVYIQNSTFTIGGSASIPSATGAAKDNDVYLASGKTITVASTLTAESPVATISLDDGEYTADRQVLQAADGGAITPDICEKFAVAQDPNGIEWSVTPDGTGTKGVLRNSTLYVRGAGAGWYTENPDYTASAGSDSNSGSKSAPFATIQKAVEKVLAMNDGATEYTIWVDGTITDSAAGANGMGDISPASTLNLKIQSMSETTHATLDAQNNGRVMNISANAAVTLKNVNITNGNTADNGGGISNSGTLTVTGGTISDCTAVPTDASDSEQGRGGAIFNNTNGTLELDGTAISDCTAGNGGGIYNNEGTFAITGGSITNCTTDGGKNVNIHHGGGIYNTVSDASLVSTISNCSITDCRAMDSTANSQYGWGGGICNNAGTLELTNVDITGGGNDINKDAYLGGGIYVYSGAALTMTGGTIKDCVSYSGGGIYIYASGTIRGTLTCTDVTVTNCTSVYGGGGGIFNSGASTTLTGCTITICKTTLRDTVTGSSPYDFGGGINNRGGILTLSGGSITGCSSVQGGGIRNSGECVITGGAEISGNNAEGGTDAGGNCGGGIYNSSKLTLENGTVSDNEAVLWGGGVYASGGSFTMTGGTVSKNKAKAGGGFAVWNKNSDAINVTISGGTITNNIASEYGGGVYNLGTLIQNGGEISSNNAASGGGVYNSTSYVINGTTFDGCKGTFTMTGGKISGNTATTDESATPNGGGVYFESGSFTMSGGEISGNTAKGAGGGVYFKGTAFTMSGTAKISGNKVTYASGGHGGGVSLKSGTFTIEGGEISENTSTGTGGGVYSSDTLIMKGGTVSTNTATTDGGGVYVNSGTAEMSGTAEISGNTATTDGGGVYVNSGTFEMSGGTISGNKATGSGDSNGGGVIVAVSSTFTMTNGTITGNTATGNGGGVLTAGTFNANGGTVSGNTPDQVYNMP